MDKLGANKDPDKPTAIFIMGPTASGKTDLAIHLASKHSCRIISVDSALVYRGMDIGTAKPTPAELRTAPHRLIDIRAPHEQYSVANFVQDAVDEVKQAQQNAETAILVGGTLLYHHALLCGLSEMPSGDPKYRQQLTDMIASEGSEKLHSMLTKVDPASAERIHPNDPQRLIRALDVYHQTGKTLSAYQASPATPVSRDWNTLTIQLRPEPRKQLHQMIAKRFHRMIEAGFVEEVRSLLALEQMDSDSPALRAVGYRQVVEHLMGKTSFDEMIELGIIATRQFAKRQFTWLRSLPADQIYNPYEADFLTLASNEISAYITAADHK